MNETTSKISPLRPPPSPLVFDAVGTIIYADPTPADVYLRVGRTYGSRHSRDEIGRRFRAAFAAEEAIDRRDLGLRTDEARERRRWQAIVAAVLDDVTDPAAVFDELWQDFARPEAWKPFADAIETVPELIRRGHTVGVASNFDARLHGIIAAHFPAIRPEHVFASSQLGYRKPSREFFAECTRRLTPAAPCDVSSKEKSGRRQPAGQPASTTLIGDDADNDFHGAQSAGWRAVLIDRDGRHPQLAPRVVDLRALFA